MWTQPLWVPTHAYEILLESSQEALLIVFTNH